MKHIGLQLKTSEPTKRNVISIATRLYDPFGIMSPVTVLFKLLFQELCQAKVEWDDLLTENHLLIWNRLATALSSSNLVTVHRYCCKSGSSYKLVGFCDASTRAYAAVVYLRSQSQDGVDVKLLASKTRVSPNSVRLTIPRLELLAALLLSRLIVSIQKALISELTIDELICYTDSRVVFYWIHGSVKIVQAVPAQQWRHCPGHSNPADIPSRGMLPNELVNNQLWFNGPKWLLHCVNDPLNVEAEPVLPDDALQEIKKGSLKPSGLLVVADTNDHSVLINCDNYSSLNKLLRVTAMVIKFVQILKLGIQKFNDDTSFDRGIRSRALRYWIKENQRDLARDTNFKLWKQQFGLFVDDAGLLRCNGRLVNSDLSHDARTPILLNKVHHFTKLIILNAHNRVLHNGVAETLNEIRTKYWLIRGRQMVRKVLASCTICRRYEGQSYQSVLPPPLPDFRVQQSRPFQVTGVDFAGPLYVRATTESKVWLCLYTCCSSRAIHLEIVPNLNAPTFIQSFSGLPRKMISDNAKTFKSATKLINVITSNYNTKEYFANLNVEWTFNLEKAPWWGGIYERMIKSVKRCMRKAIGRSSLSYDELLTIVVEVEGVVNCRPLTYLSTDDFGEPLTPSHLLTGSRIINLPDPLTDDVVLDVDYDEKGVGLTRWMKYLSSLMEKFWKKWRSEYLIELRENHRYSKLKHGVKSGVLKGDVVTVFDENHPRGYWRLGRIDDVIPSTDGMVRAVTVKVQSKSGRTQLLRRPVQHLYPLEVIYDDPLKPSHLIVPAVTQEVRDKQLQGLERRPVRQAAAKAKVL